MPIRRCTGLEVYCARDYFGYNCKHTPHNCTECPVMRFLYHDLTNRVLDCDSAADLIKLVEENEVFTGKFDGAQSLPLEVWQAIYTIRKVFFDCAREDIPECEGYSSKERRQYFPAWVNEHGTYKGLSTGEAILKIAFHDIFEGRWFVFKKDYNDEPVLEEDSGILKPAVFDDAADGIQYITDLINNDLEQDPAISEIDYVIGISHITTPSKLFRRFHLFAMPNGLYFSYFPENIRERKMKQLENLSYSLYKIDAEYASDYRNRYLNSVKERFPTIQYTVTSLNNIYPSDPNHPIHQEPTTLFPDEDGDEDVIFSE